jgi:Zn-dependent peptidase ImmA (M78 family)
MNRVEVRPGLFRWALERSGFSPDALAGRFPKLEAWERGEILPTLRQLELFASATHVPIGYLFLAAPPVEAVPIPEFRTIGGQRVGRPSPDLLDMLYVPRAFVGSARVQNDVVSSAATIRDLLGFDLDDRRRMPTWTDALRRFIEQADGLGILVMCSGVVLNNNRRHLDPDEFRGFALADSLAPLVFINGADTKAAQMFTLAHELAHIWLGQSAVSDAQAASVPEHAVERWCNEVAAEVLVPLAVLRDEYDEASALPSEAARLARHFKVSTLVILRRIHDAGGITRPELRDAYAEELERLRAVPRGSGGDFYLTQAARVSKRFARALVASTLEGQTLHRDAFRMLGFSKLATFHELRRSLGVLV